MKKLLLPLVFILPFALEASDCKFEKRIDLSLDLTDSEELRVIAAAGDLKIRGIPGSNTATIKGQVCASKKEWLSQARIETNDGKRAQIAVELPAVSNDSSWRGHSYLYADLELEVPANLALDVRDSSGDIRIESVGMLAVSDSSGDLRIEDASGPVTVRDSSGDIELSDIQQDVIIESDSSGDIRGQHIDGGVLVMSDSSGDISFKDVGKDFIVEKDSSGSISADRVGGDFQVMHDGSGEIEAKNVTGKVLMPEDRS